MVLLAARQNPLYAVDEWLRGTNYTGRFVITKDGVAENFTDWQQLSIGVKGEGVVGPNTNLAAVLFDDEAGGFAAGAFQVSLLPEALELGRVERDDISQIVYTVVARRNNFEDRIVAHVTINVGDSGLV